MKGMMRRASRVLTRAILTVLLAVQALGGGAVALAHARDVTTTAAAFESRHDARCVVLHDALRCALCHYASSQVTVQRAAITPPSQPTRSLVPSRRRIVVVASAIHRTAPARAPPALLS